MKKYLAAVAAITLLSAVTSGLFTEQKKKREMRGGMHYDTATVETISGEVIKVDEAYRKMINSVGVHLLVKTDKETIWVHLGPKRYLQSQSVKIMLGDKITVKGSRITLKDKPVILAAEITKDGEVLKMRDENGIPLWAGKKSGK